MYRIVLLTMFGEKKVIFNMAIHSARVSPIWSKISNRSRIERNKVREDRTTHFARVLFVDSNTVIVKISKIDSKGGDVLIVDRGFTDVTKLLNERGIKTPMPHSVNKSVKQHSTEEANESRLVTKVR